MQSVIQIDRPRKANGAAAGMTTARKFEVTCAGCNMREMCMPQGLNRDEMLRMENLVYSRRRVKRASMAWSTAVSMRARRAAFSVGS